MELISDDEIDASVPRNLSLAPVDPCSSLLGVIQDPRMFASVVGTLCGLATEAGGDSGVVEGLARQMLAARGLRPTAMLKNLNQSDQNIRAHKERYNALGSGTTRDEMRGLLGRIQKEITAAREQEEQYYTLERYREKKEEEIAPALGTAFASKRERFRQVVKNKHGPRQVKGGYFYNSSAIETLRNGYHAENDCYLTMGSFQHLKTIYGHASEQEIDSYSPIFNALYDQSEQLMLSGGEEGLVKVWHRRSGTLIGTLKGHTDFINKIEVSPCNRYIVTCSGDGIRFFDLRTLKSLGGWKSGSIVEISIRVIDGQTIFMFGDDTHLYLLTEQTILEKVQASQCLTTDDFTCINFSASLSRNNVNTIVIAPSPDQTHLLLGLQNGQMIVTQMSEILALLDTGIKGEEVEIPNLRSTRIHGDEIVEVKWREDSSMWATGSRDGRCCLWELRNGRPAEIETLAVNRGNKGRKKRIFACSYICWNCTHSHFAAGFQEVVEEEDNQRGQGEVLIYSLAQHAVTCEVSRDVSLKIGGIKAMDSHPFYPNILLICEAEGHIILFDLFLGSIVNVFEERGYHMLHPQFCLIPSECRFSRDGMGFLVATEYGSVSLYGYDAKSFYQLNPTEQFLTTDFVEFRTQAESLKVVAVTIDFPEDLNSHPRGQILSIKGDPHFNQFLLDRQHFMSELFKSQDLTQHQPSYKWEESYMQKVAWWLDKATVRDNTYWRTFEEMQGSKQLILFHEKQRQFAKINSVTEQKLTELRVQLRKNKGEEEHEEQQMSVEEAPRQEMRLRNKRKTKRRTNRPQINYADDFEYDEADEEDYNAGQDFLENDLPQEEEQEEESSEEERQPEHPRLRRREPRRQIRHLRPTRLHPPAEERQPEMVQYRLPRRRRELSDVDINEMLQEGDSRPRKKVKQDEQFEESRSEQEENKPSFSRLRKCREESEMEEEVLECYRCQAAKATRFCHGCEFGQSYCDHCSALRGKRQGDRYKCLICLFLQNESQQETENIDESACRMVRREYTRYTPQLQDEVRFLFQGYEEFLMTNIMRLNSRVAREDQNYRLLPHYENLSLLHAPKCVVEQIKYYYPLKGKSGSEGARKVPARTESSPILMLVGLRTDEDYYFDVFFTGAAQPQFLVPQQVYQATTSHYGLQVNQLVRYQGEEVQVVQIGPVEGLYSDSLYKTVKIRKTEGKRLRGNTKENEKRVSLWKLQGEIQPQDWVCGISEAICTRMTEVIARWQQGEVESFMIFVDYVDLDIWPDYRQAVHVGMCLTTIHDRLLNNYYRSEASLKEDINLVYSNSVKFNGPHHEVTKGAENLFNAMMSLIDGDQLPPTAKKTVESSESKRERRKKESPEPEASVSVQSGLMLRSRATRRKKKLSFDYEEEYDGGSDSDVEMGILTRNNGRRTNKAANPQPLRVTRSRLNH